MVTGGGGERAPDSATIMTTTTTSVARMDMFRLVWLFLTNVLRLVLDVYERRGSFGLPVEKVNRVYVVLSRESNSSGLQSPVMHRLWRYLSVGNLVDSGKPMLIRKR